MNQQGDDHNGAGQQRDYASELALGKRAADAFAGWRAARRWQCFNVENFHVRQIWLRPLRKLT